ncbi:MAG: hypothetical protein E7365_03495 [Clostridiales bacterium]|nr:hypothetical protein [Clostridiales bacterium]
MRKFLYYIITGVLTLTILALSVVTIFKSNELSEVKLKYENSLISSTQEAISSMRTIESDLSKLMISVDEKVINQLLSVVALKSASCGQELSRLPIVATGVQNTLKFTNQLSSYCTTVIKNYSEGFKLPDNFDKQIQEFFDTCKQVNAELNMVEADILSRKISLLNVNDGKTETSGMFGSIGENLIEYPSVIFDGPFSDGQERNTPKQDRNEVTVEQAQEYVKKLGFDCSFKNEITGEQPLYLFESDALTLQVTKKGGLLYLALSDREISDAVLTNEQAEQKANEFVKKLGFGKVKNVWQEYYGNFIVFNFVPVVDDVVIYPDIFKVKIALDDGSVVAFEGKSYIMNNHNRTIDEIKITKQQAQKNLKEGFMVETSRVALISINEKEQLCYEFFGKYNDLDFAVYFSAIDGKEKTSFRILSTETGKMAV